jgi:hypothetical protein
VLKTLKFLLIMFGVSVLIGCTTTTIQKGNYFQNNIVTPISGHVILNIYNPYSGIEKYKGKTLGSGYEPTIFIDGQEIVTLPNQTYTTVLIPPGAHIGGILFKGVEQMLFTNAKPKKGTPFYLDSKKQYYLEYARDLGEKTITSESGSVYISGGFVSIPMVTEFVVPVDARFNVFDKFDRAKSIVQCRYVVPKMIELDNNTTK